MSEMDALNAVEMAEVEDFETSRRKEAEQQEKAARRKQMKHKRISRRREERHRAKQLLHKLGSGNRRCKRCGLKKAEAFLGRCAKK